MLELQIKLLSDKTRNEAFYQALKYYLNLGKKTVADLGSGTGFLSFLAEKLGATSCIGYELNDGICLLSKKLAVENKMKKCKFIHAHSIEIGNAPTVDIVVSETLGNFALEENILETLRDAARFLKPGGIMIPNKLTQYVVPVTSSDVYQKTNVWDAVGYGITMNVAKRDALTNMYVQTFKSDDILNDPDAIKVWDEIDFTNPKEKSVRTAKVVWNITRAIEVYGFAIWWNAALAPGIRLSTSPFEPPTHWEQIFLPLVAPISLKNNEKLVLDLRSDTRPEVGIDVQWRASKK